MHVPHAVRPRAYLGAFFLAALAAHSSAAALPAADAILADTGTAGGGVVSEEHRYGTETKEPNPQNGEDELEDHCQLGRNRSVHSIMLPSSD